MPDLLGGLTMMALSLIAGTGPARADGGKIEYSTRSGSWIITVFSSPTPLRAGPADISVMVQDAASRAPVLDAAVTLSIALQESDGRSDGVWKAPCCRMRRDGSLAELRASREGARNKLLYSAPVEFDRSGKWTVNVHAQSGDLDAATRGAIEVYRPLPPALAFWPCLAFPPAAIGAFALHQRLKRNRKPEGRTRKEEG